MLRLPFRLRLWRISISEDSCLGRYRQIIHHWRAQSETAHSTEKTVTGVPLIFVLRKSVSETHCPPFWSREFPSRGFSISPEILRADSIRLVLTQELDVTKSVSPLLGYNRVSLLRTIGNWPTWSAHGANVSWLLEILLWDTLNSLRAVFLFGDYWVLTSLTHLHYSYYYDTCIFKLLGSILWHWKKRGSLYSSSI